MDALSETLRLITLRGAVFYNAEFSAPWSFRSPPSRALGAHLSLEAEHVIVYHLVAEGRAWAQCDNRPRVELGPGDIVMFPHGDTHVMGNGSTATPVNLGTELERIFTQGLETVRMGGAGEITRFICGYLACDPELSQRVLAGLPPLLKVNVRDDPSGIWLENSIRFSVANAGSQAAGAAATLAKLSEAVFVETLRRYIALLPLDETGWLAGVRDPEVGKALGLLHGEPAHPWTVAGLAAQVGVCRAALAQRFRHYLGEPPIAYLTRWRLQLGARLLGATNQSVAEIAAGVGYDSEAAFNRAFKRHFGIPPARFRRQSRAARGEARTAGPL